MPPSGNILLYQTEDGQTRIDVTLRDDTVWLPLARLADLFPRDKSVISRHIENVFEERELAPDPVKLRAPNEWHNKSNRY